MSVSPLRPPRSLSVKCERTSKRRSVRLAHFFDRIHQHALRSANRADGAQPAVANPVVNGPARDSQEGRGLLDADAAAYLRLKIGLRKSQRLNVHAESALRLYVLAGVMPTTGFTV